MHAGNVNFALAEAPEMNKIWCAHFFLWSIPLQVVKTVHSTNKKRLFLRKLFLLIPR